MPEAVTALQPRAFAPEPRAETILSKPTTTAAAGSGAARCRCVLPIPQARQSRVWSANC